LKETKIQEEKKPVNTSKQVTLPKKNDTVKQQVSESPDAGSESIDSAEEDEEDKEEIKEEKQEEQAKGETDQNKSEEKGDEPETEEQAKNDQNDKEIEKEDEEMENNEKGEEETERNEEQESVAGKKKEIVLRLNLQTKGLLRLANQIPFKKNPIMFLILNFLKPRILNQR